MRCLSPRLSHRTGRRIPTQLSYIDTANAKQGALGSEVLPPAPTGVVWKAGTEVNATWTVRANHGGGYAYAPKRAGE